MGVTGQMLMDVLDNPDAEKCPVCGFLADHDPAVHTMKEQD